jgi:hypothetical protein
MRHEKTSQAPDMPSAPATAADQASGTGTAGGPEYRVAPLPQAEVEKLQQVERELAEGTGEEIVVVAYQKQRC